MKPTLPALLLSSIFLVGCNLIPGATVPADSQTMEDENIAQFLSLNGSGVCTVTNLSDNSVLEMTLSGEKMKIMGMNMMEGQSGTMINDSEYVYTWVDGQNTGFKTKIITDAEGVQAEEEETMTADEAAAVYDDENLYRTECEARDIPFSEFDPPSNINFVDTSSFQQMSPEEIRNSLPQMMDQ